MTKSESRIQAEILLAINQRGHRLYRSNAGTIKDERTGSWIKLFPKGFPDTVGFHRDTGKFIVIEVKNKAGRLSKDQIAFKDFIINQPVIYGVARSANEAVDIIEGGAVYHD